jgi:hypothetical protein
MAVRNTESRIPGGFDKASDLGEAVYSEDNHYALVSYLTAPLRLIQNPEKKLQLRNTYVLFVENTDPTGYKFSVDCYLAADEYSEDPDTRTPSFTTPPVEYESGVFEFDVTETIGTLSLAEISAIRVNVEILGVNPSVTLNQYQVLSEPIQYIEDLINGINTNAPMGGSPYTTRLIANNYREYLINEFEKGSIPVNIGASILYYRVQDLNSGSQARENERDWYRYLNEGKDINLKNAPIGIMQFKPSILAMFLKKSNGDLYGSIEQRGENTSQAKYEQILWDKFKEDPGLLDPGDRVDLFNLLRFPKSCIRVCNTLLQLRKEEEAWKDLTKEQLLFPEGKDCIQRIITESEFGLSENFQKVSVMSCWVVDKMLTSYIRAIVENDLPEYELIRIKVLDIRSGKPIKNAKVRKLIIWGDDNREIIVKSVGTDDQSFPYNKNKITENNLKGAFRALVRLGYAGIDRRDQNDEDNWCTKKWGQEPSNAYNSYWSDRFPNPPPDITIPTSDDSKEPKEYMYKYILAEYNNHAFTDANGILNVQIPNNFLHGRGVSIKVGFWEFPIAVEELKNNTAQNPICRADINRSPKSGATEFNVEWVATPQGPNPQSSDWQENLNGQDFGWKVSNKDGDHSSMLMVAQRLEIKNGTEEFTEFNRNLLSKFYDPTSAENQYHFLLFGMQWCQPVWAPIPGTATSRILGKIGPQDGSSSSSFEAIPLNTRNFPIMVSIKSGSGSGKGRDYGMLVPNTASAVDENNNQIINPCADTAVVTINTYQPPHVSPRNNIHDGIDYYGIEGISPVFIPHGGIIHTNGIMGTQKVISNSRGYGITRIIKYKEYFFRVAHLHGDPNRDDANPDLSLYDLNVGDIVMAGLKIGFAGRTYWEHHAINDPQKKSRYYEEGATHLHLEICRNGVSRRIANPLSIFNNFQDERENRILFLNNDSYRLFPCDCHWPTGSTYTAQNCAVRTAINPSTIVSSECWASRNLHCPYLSGTSLYKAQLVFLAETPPGNTDLNPGSIDDTWGSSVQEAIKEFREIYQDEIYINIPIPPNNDPLWITEPTDGDATQLVLNTHAPYPRTNFFRPDQ